MKDIFKFLVAGAHLSGTKLQMDLYTYTRKNKGIYVINLKKTWQRLLLTAWAMVAIENPDDVRAISSRNISGPTLLKFVAVVGATPVAGCFMPEIITNSSKQPSGSHRF